VSFLFRGVVLGGRWGRVRFDGGLALLPLEPGDLVAEALDLRLGCLEVRHDVFEPVEQLLHEVARAVIRDAVQVKVFKHVALGSKYREVTQVERHYAGFRRAWQPCQARDLIPTDY